MPEPVGAEGRYSDQPVGPLLAAQVPVGVFPADLDGCGPDAGSPGVRDVQDFSRAAFAVGPAGVHSQEGLGPVLGVGPSLSRLDGQDGGTAVVVSGHGEREEKGVEVLPELGGFEVEPGV